MLEPSKLKKIHQPTLKILDILQEGLVRELLLGHLTAREIGNLRATNRSICAMLDANITDISVCSKALLRAALFNCLRTRYIPAGTSSQDHLHQHHSSVAVALQMWPELKGMAVHDQRTFSNSTNSNGNKSMPALMDFLANLHWLAPAVATPHMQVPGHPAPGVIGNALVSPTSASEHAAAPAASAAVSPNQGVCTLLMTRHRSAKLLQSLPLLIRP